LPAVVAGWCAQSVTCASCHGMRRDPEDANLTRRRPWERYSAPREEEVERIKERRTFLCLAQDWAANSVSAVAQAIVVVMSACAMIGGVLFLVEAAYKRLDPANVIDEIYPFNGEHFHLHEHRLAAVVAYNESVRSHNDFLTVCGNAHKLVENVTFLKLDCDEYPGACAQHPFRDVLGEEARPSSEPAVVFYRDGVASSASFHAALKNMTDVPPAPRTKEQQLRVLEEWALKRSTEEPEPSPWAADNGFRGDYDRWRGGRYGGDFGLGDDFGHDLGHAAKAHEGAKADAEDNASKEPEQVPVSDASAVSEPDPQVPVSEPALEQFS